MRWLERSSERTKEKKENVREKAHWIYLMKRRQQ